MAGSLVSTQGTQKTGGTVSAVVQKRTATGSLHATLRSTGAFGVLRLRDEILEDETQSCCRASHPNPLPAAGTYRCVQSTRGAHDRQETPSGTREADPKRFHHRVFLPQRLLHPHHAVPDGEADVLHRDSSLRTGKRGSDGSG